MAHSSSNSFFIFSLTLVFSYFLICTECKKQYVQPLNMGMQVAIPYDIANIFNRPVNFGPIAGLISAGALLYILFFGVITAPFGYFFGVPSEKYVLGDSWGSLTGIRNDTKSTSRSLNEGISVGNILPFQDQVFSRLPDVRNNECRKMILCSAHNGVKHLPMGFLKIYRFFSQKLVEINTEMKDAINTGLNLNEEETCEGHYTHCKDSVFGILMRSIVRSMPTWMRRKGLKPELTY